MKKVDFTHVGGFPLTQEGLDYLQQAYTECVNALAAMGGDGGIPVTISGMNVLLFGTTTAVDNGWFFYNGEMIPFTASSVTPTGTDVPLVQISSVSTTLSYNDGTLHPALLGKTATLIAGASVTNATHFPLANMRPFQYAFGLAGRESAWNNIVVGTTVASGGVTGTIYYKKNFLNNTLHIRAALTTNNAQNLAASPGAGNTLVATLPSGYVPSNNAYFTSYFFAANMFKDDLGVSWVKHITGVLNTGGQVLINFIKPDISISAYSMVFNTIIPLD